MTPACIVWMRDLIDRVPTIAGQVLDVGSQDVNGTARIVFDDLVRFPRYVGLDLEVGKAVDVQAKADALPFHDGRFEVLVCTEMLEHDDRFWLSLQEFSRVLTLGGALVLTTRGLGFPRHDYPSDYWRFTAPGLRAALEWAGFGEIDVVEDREDMGAFAYAQKVGDSIPQLKRETPVVESLLTDAEVDVIAERFSRFAQMGVTYLTDALSRVVSDRNLLLGLLDRCVQRLRKEERMVSDVRRVIGEEVPRERSNCLSCRSISLVPILSMGNQHLTGFGLNNDRPPTCPLDLLICRACTLVQLRHTCPPSWLYTWYGYRSGINPMMVEALRDVVDSVTERIELTTGDVVVDIGSNDGTLLRLYGGGLVTVGFDPAENLAEVGSQGVEFFVNDYFSMDAYGQVMQDYGPAKVVTAIAMFYDLENPSLFLKDVGAILADDGLLVIQMNYLGAMLERTTFDNISHEHLAYYSLRSLLPVIQREGFCVFDVETNDVNSGSFRVYCCRQHMIGEKYLPTERPRKMIDQENEAGLGEMEVYGDFARKCRSIRENLQALVSSIRESRKTIYVYGASTRGLVIMEYAGLDGSVIDGAAERNPEKYGRIYSGTGIRCVPEEEAREKADYFLVLPYHFLGEFIKRESEFLNRGGRFIVPLPSVRMVGATGEVL